MSTQDFSKINLNQGLSQENWQSLILDFEKSENPMAWIQNIKTVHPEIGDKALEAGFFEFASYSGCSHPLLQFKSLMLSGYISKAHQFLDEILDPTTKVFCELFKFKQEGRFQEAYKKYHQQMELLFEKLKSPIDLETKLIWASVLYPLNKWTEITQIYKSVVELSEQKQLTAYKAIGSFNLATLYQNQKLSLESRTWLWVAQKELAHYKLESLKSSMELFTIQCALQNQKYIEVMNLTPEFLKKENISSHQQLRAWQAFAEAQMELGYIFDCEVSLAQSRKLLIESKSNQHAASQKTLELNLASITHRSYLLEKKTPIDHKLIQIQHQAAQARWAIKMNDLARALRLTLQIKRESDNSNEFDDLYVLLTNRLEQPGEKARTLENQIYKCLLSKQWKALEYLQVHLEIENPDSPWKKSLNYFLKGVLSHLSQNSNSSESHFLKCFELCRRSGLERLETLAVHFARSLGYTKDIQSHFTLDPSELAFYDSLLSKITIKATALTRNSSGQIQLDSTDSDLILDEVKEEIIWQGQSYSIRNQPLLKRILRSMFDRIEGLRKEELINEVWGLEYHPLHHDSMVYAAIARLRDQIPIEIRDGKYRLPSDIKVSLLSSNRLDSIKLNERQRKILQSFEIENSIQRKYLVEKLGISERTALRELSELVRLGLLKQKGSGRGVHYVRNQWNQGA